MKVENLIQNASKALKFNNIATHILDAELLLANIMNVPREYLLTNRDVIISQKNKYEFQKAIARRAKREPVAYITKKKEFWSLDFTVNHSTLVPRPETELLVYETLKFFKHKRINILDIGTGSGCILISLLKELKSSRGIGIDISKKTLKIAKKNSKKIGTYNRSKFIFSSINKFNSGKYDLIVSNPPYISINNLKKLNKEITDHEPLSALNGGIDGLDLIKKIIYKSIRLLKINGLLAIEIGSSQYSKVSRLMEKNGYREVSKVVDFRKNVRCIISTKN